MGNTKLKIIFGRTHEEMFDHAKEMMKAMKEFEQKYPLRASPKGVAHHTAHFPLRCDDCGETYWSRDEYGLHKACRGYPLKKTGF